MQRRNFVRAAGCAAAFAWTAGWTAQKPRTIWSKEAFDAARPAAEAVQRHPFVTGVFAGTLRKSAFVSYLEQNLFYLSSYARALDVVAGRLGELSGFSKESQDFARWAQETRDLRQWTIDFASSLTGSRIDEKALCKGFTIKGREKIKEANTKPSKLKTKERLKYSFKNCPKKLFCEKLMSK